MAPSDDNGAPRLTLGSDCSATLEKPRAFVAMALARGREQLTRDPSVTIGITCAALRLTWPTTRKFPGLPVRPWKLGDPLVDYGAEVFDALFQADIPVDAILEAAARAYQFALERLSEQEVVSAENFSDRPAGGENAA